MSVSSRILYMKSIIVLLGAIMLLACKNDIKEVNALAEREKRPDMTGENLELVYSDSARIKYRVLAPEYIKVNREKEKYEEFPKGIHVLSYDPAGKMIGSIKAKYAKKLEDEMLWEARNEVVIINAEGKKLETELLYWDMKKELIYSDRCVKLRCLRIFQVVSKLKSNNVSNDSNPFGDIDLSSVICILFGNGDRFPDF